MTAREVLSKIQFQLVEAHGHMSGMSAPIDRQADRIIAELHKAGYVIIKDRMDPEGGIPGRS